MATHALSPSPDESSSQKEFPTVLLADGPCIIQRFPGSQDGKKTDFAVAIFQIYIRKDVYPFKYQGSHQEVWPTTNDNISTIYSKPETLQDYKP